MSLDWGNQPGFTPDSSLQVVMKVIMMQHCIPVPDGLAMVRWAHMYVVCCTRVIVGYSLYVLSVYVGHS